MISACYFLFSSQLKADPDHWKFSNWDKLNTLISMSLSTLLLLGNVLKTGYSAYGLSALPFYLI